MPPRPTSYTIVTCLLMIGCGQPAELDRLHASETGGLKENATMPTVRVRVLGPDGQLTPPMELPKVILPDAEWAKRLTRQQFRITRRQGTEPAFCGGLLNHKGVGVYACICCNLPLFESTAKFDSRTGWPSFFRSIASENIREELDTSHGMIRTEILCMRCDAHLGHVFKDGPPPTGRRYCLNSEAMRFVPEDQLHTIAEKPATGASTAPVTGKLVSTQERSEALAEAVLAGGCFWCVEAVFRQLDGVAEAVSGYSGGTEKAANYRAVSTKRTGHAEAVKIVYDPAKISYEELLRVHFATHDPTTRNRQGNDIGPQYRSAIFYANEQEKEVAEAFIADLNEAKVFKRPIVTTLEPLKAFYPAEREHQDFVTCNPLHPYVRSVALPKVEKVREKFKDLVKPEN